MAQLLVRSLEDQVKERLRRRARRHGRSMEEEVREILRDAVKRDDEPRRSLGTRLAARFSAFRLDQGLRELRGEPAQPASLEE